MEMKSISPSIVDAQNFFTCDICGQRRLLGIETNTAAWVSRETSVLDICNECILAMSAICPPNVQFLHPKKLLAALVVANMKALIEVLKGEQPSIENEQAAKESVLATDMMEELNGILEKMF